MTVVSQLTERELVARIQQRLAPPPDWLLVGIGDDAAVVEPERNRVEVLTVDAIVEGVHFDRAFTPPEAIGHRALAVNLSDLAAMGAAPRLALLSMALPPSLPLDDYDGIANGIAQLAAAHRLHVVGGNLTKSPGPLAIDVTVVGTVKRRQALRRSGARAGDDVYVSGTLGAAAAGLALLKQNGASAAAPPADRESALVERYLRPQPRVRLGLMLARNRAASACIDLSDGLADGLHRIADASGVGMAIDADALPIDPSARARFDARGDDAVRAALCGGDDYELLFTVRPRTRRRLTAAERHGGAPLTRIGTCTADRLVVLQRAGASTPVPEGYSHFAP
ncbi:MAG: thiamine-phosphate kinase [Acidobacteria bacterium]|nr:MAG: thiamine-phosphate kinase [Acidobacteriota bacterium]